MSKLVLNQDIPKTLEFFLSLTRIYVHILIFGTKIYFYFLRASYFVETSFYIKIYKKRLNFSSRLQESIFIS